MTRTAKILIAAVLLVAAAAISFPLLHAVQEANAQANAAAHPFSEIAKVLQHPRCMNCHPRDDTPRQGADRHPHQMLITRGKDDHGAVAARCSACHRDENNEFTGVPGAPHWGLAPKSMGWQGLSVGQLCANLKDRKLNGNKSLDQLVEHMEKDELVKWGWKPGKDREPVPIGHEDFVKVVKAWAALGGPCP